MLATLASLFPDVELLNNFPVPADILLHQVIEEAPAFPDHLQQSEAAVMVFFMLVQVRRQCVDVRGQNGNLDFRRPGISRTLSVLFQNVRLLFLRQ